MDVLKLFKEKDNVALWVEGYEIYMELADKLKKHNYHGALRGYFYDKKADGICLIKKVDRLHIMYSSSSKTKIQAEEYAFEGEYEFVLYELSPIDEFFKDANRNAKLERRHWRSKQI